MGESAASRASTVRLREEREARQSVVKVPLPVKLDSPLRVMRSSMLHAAALSIVGSIQTSVSLAALSAKSRISSNAGLLRRPYSRKSRSCGRLAKLVKGESPMMLGSYEYRTPIERHAKARACVSRGNRSTCQPHQAEDNDGNRLENGDRPSSKCGLCRKAVGRLVV